MKSSREQFEEWIDSQDGMGLMAYSDGSTIAWEAWQASRAAIEVELPDLTDAQYQSKHIDGGFRAEAFWLHVRKCIARAGLKVKS